MLIKGENAMIFLPHGYGMSVVVGHVVEEYPNGWTVYPCREVLATNNGDCWIALARGDESIRRACTFGDVFEMRIPLGVYSITWSGDLP